MEYQLQLSGIAGLGNHFGVRIASRIRGFDPGGDKIPLR